MKQNCQMVLDMEQPAQMLMDQVFLTRQQEESPGEYQPYPHVRDYLRQQFEECGKTVPELARACGYRKLDKFRRRIGPWLQAKKPVPRAFLDAIGAYPETVCQKMLLDFEDFQAAAKIARLPKTFSVRTLAQGWEILVLPEGLSQTRAVSLVREHARFKNRQCLISLQGLREIWIDPDGTVYDCFLWPSLKFREGKLYFHQVSARAGLAKPGK